MTTEMRDWLCDNIGPEGTKYYWDTPMIGIAGSDTDFSIPTRHFAVTFDYDDDATLFKLRWL
jgi:hypothetical protein